MKRMNHTHVIVSYSHCNFNSRTTLKISKHKLFAKLSKCSFGLQQVYYLGHNVSGLGVAINKNKVQAVLDWPCPKNLKQLRGFLGFTIYYRRFIKQYAMVAALLANLLKKDNFKWDDFAHASFAALKIVVTQAPILALPDFSKPFVLETNALGMGIGAVLNQDHHLVTFFSKKLTASMQKQSAYTREFYAHYKKNANF
uniref:Reverse transcriptase/retrotransposon-derived protein RNase H-like domain-containing protein n=1 Tax=Cajanus cajan TaxID=3821 RepID=A0A151RFF7_CAJCA|nr:hypothetical protein KK1_037391 [Cajanus cajan]